MATPAQQLEIERWRALALTLNRMEAKQEAHDEKLGALKATNERQASTIETLTAQVSALKADAASKPLSQLWTAFLVGDWKVKAAIVAPPLLLAYALAAGQPLVAVATDLLTTARLCFGRLEPTHGP